MAKKRKKFYISTAIDYVNATPHLGHALEKIQADIIARYHRILGEDVFFLTGTDENSLKNVQAAREERVPVKKLVDRNAKKFYELKKTLNLTSDDFIKTTEKRHIKGVQKLWQVCQKDIYKKLYQGLYCVGCEEFYKENELVNGLCPEHQSKPELVKEENYFFKLTNYQDKLKKIIENNELEIIPQSRKNETLSFINSGLEDICISRSAERAQGWGIDVPGDSTQKIWVWFDALSSYINTLGYPENSQKFKKYWPADLHVIGKGILRFHAIYWPAILLSANLPLPKKIFVHGYLTSGGQKMSKSLGNVIDPFELVKKYGTDPVRYFLLREIPSTEDGDFTYEKFETRYNADLANGIGNTLRRVLTIAEKYNNGIIPEYKPLPIYKEEKGIDFNPLRDDISRRVLSPLVNIDKHFDFDFYLDNIINGFKEIDKDIEKVKPWDKWIHDTSEAEYFLYSWLEAIRQLTYALSPFLPETSYEIFTQLGLDPEKEKVKKFERGKEWGELKPGTKIKKGKPLFPRL